MESQRFKTVSKEEFEKFVKNYPNKLSWDVVTICEPPMGNYNDFSNGKKWPESIIAKVTMHWLGPNNEIDEEGHKKFWEYKILNE